MYSKMDESLVLNMMRHTNKMMSWWVFNYVFWCLTISELMPGRVKQTTDEVAPNDFPHIWMHNFR